MKSTAEIHQQLGRRKMRGGTHAKNRQSYRKEIRDSRLILATALYGKEVYVNPEAPICEVLSLTILRSW